MAIDYIMVGGFLGAGKTTAILRLAEYLVAHGRRVALITNDQSERLVDTALVAAAGHPVREIAGGCFCCRFDSLTEAVRGLARDAAPDVILAEPVGSCTDLRATVQHPLQALHGHDYRVAPLSVLVDPLRAARLFGLDPGPSFSLKVQYVYQKQLEEADLIVINKIDFLPDDLRGELERLLAARYPDAVVLSVSARQGTNLEAWFDRLTGTEPASRRAMELDYDAYAEGEALLGWLNATVRASASRPFDGDRLLRRVAEQVRARLEADHIEIAHLKMTFAPDGGGKLAVLNLVRTDGWPESPRLLAGTVGDGELTVNLRAEGDPDRLRATFDAALDEAGRQAAVTLTPLEVDCFRPGRPRPTHRMATTNAPRQVR